jgi:hypothetical protein
MIDLSVRADQPVYANSYGDFLPELLKILQEAFTSVAQISDNEGKDTSHD